MNTPDTTTTTPDPLHQAGELLQMFAAGRRLGPAGIERDSAIVLASVQWAAAVELRRIGDLLEGLVEGIQQIDLAQNLAAIRAAERSEVWHP